MKKNVIVTTLMATVMSFAAFGAELYSWEKDLQGWEGTSGSKLEAVDASGGAPSGAITDAQYAMKITQPNGSWRQVALNKEEAKEAILKNNNLELDVFIPAEALPSGEGSYAYMEIVIQGAMGNAPAFRISKKVDFDINEKEGKKYHLSWKYADEKDFKKDASWIQLIIVTNSPKGKMSPIYVDNFRISCKQDH